MAEFVRHSPCDACDSSDALAIYEDGTGYCFSCNTYFKGEGDSKPGAKKKRKPPTALLEGEPMPLPKRGLALETCRKWDYLCGVDKGGEPIQIATYYDASGQPCAQKIRYADKRMRFVGEPKKAGLFGAQLWPEGGKKIVITEGEIDALSMSQVQGNKWPVVSVPNGSAAARKDLAKHLEYLESFDEIVLMFDQDEPGLAAAAECAELFSPGKVRIAKLPMKDPNEMLVAGKVRELVSAMWDARPYRPDGVFGAGDLWEQIIHEPPYGIPYPWPALDKMLCGQRRGEITTWAAGVGVGKTTFVRHVIDRLVKEGEAVAVLSFEETPRQVLLGQLGLRMGVRLHEPEVWKGVTRAQIRKAYDSYPRDRLWITCQELNSDDLGKRVRFLAHAAGVRWIVLDHITALVAGVGTKEEWERIDRVMRQVRELVRTLDLGVHVVSHLTKSDGDPAEEGGRVTLKHLRGSALQRDSHAIIAVERNQQDETQKNQATLRVLKNRLTGATGLAGRVIYQPDTGRLVEAPAVEMPPVEENGASNTDGPPGQQLKDF